MRYARKQIPFLIGRVTNLTDETQRLRDLLRDRDEEIQRLEDASQVHDGEEHKVSLIHVFPLTDR